MEATSSGTISHSLRVVWVGGGGGSGKFDLLQVLQYVGLRSDSSLFPFLPRYLRDELMNAYCELYMLELHDT